jgi:hypothetical protein
MVMMYRIVNHLKKLCRFPFEHKVLYLYSAFIEPLRVRLSHFLHYTAFNLLVEHIGNY